MRISLGISMFLILLVLPIVYSANGTNYSVEIFSSGTQAGVTNETYDSRFILTVNTGTLNASGVVYSSNIGFYNGTFSLNVPIINSYEIYPTSATVGSIIRFYVSAQGAQSLWALVARPDSVTDFVSLNNNNYTYYVSTDSTGAYSVTFYANNSAGITDVTTSFQIVNVVVQPPSSGGGASCEYVWSCTEWSACASGNQQRTCRNIGTCSGDKGRPDETRTCEESLFDVKINPESIKIVENGLKFSMNLTEVKGNEKIDVTITYNVTDKNGTIVYSETETIAVYGNISFDKILKDIGLGSGDYQLNAEITYGKNQKAVAAYTFKITDKGVEEARPVTVRPLQEFLTIIPMFILSLSLVLFLLLIVLRIYFYVRNKKELANVKTVTEHDVFRDITPERNVLFTKIKRIFKLKVPARKIGVSSIVDVMNREVFLNSGEHIGSVSDVTISDIKIESLIVKLNERFSKSGINRAIIKQKNVKYYGDIVLVNKGIASVLKSTIPQKKHNKRNKRTTPKAVVRENIEENNFRNGVYNYNPNKRTNSK
jgi:sporulation protein YlmC with PRC-barrel domain